MGNFLCPQHPFRCVITGPSECGNSGDLTNLILNTIIECDKIYIYSPSLHQDLYQKIIRCFSNSIPIHRIPNNFNEDVIDVVIDEVVNDKDFRNQILK